MIHASCPPGDIIPTHGQQGTHETCYVVEGLVRVFVAYPDGGKTSRPLEPGQAHGTRFFPDFTWPED
jgi:quercetin 2,3-dioxygenase